MCSLERQTQQHLTPIREPGGAIAALLEASGETPRQRLHRLLVLLCELTDMQTAFVSVLDDNAGQSTCLAVAADGTALDALHSGIDAWYRRIVTDRMLMICDATEDSDPSCRPATGEITILSAIGVVLNARDGNPIGTLGALSSKARPDLNERDCRLIRRLGAAAEPALLALEKNDESFNLPAIRSLVRPILETIAEITGMASVYLSTVDLINGTQTIRVALNRRDDFDIPEGYTVVWSDTLCKRALEQQRPVCCNVPEVWPDNEAARGLGIATFMSFPVHGPSGKLWGTLCCADDRSVDTIDVHRRALELFAKLVTAEIGRNHREESERQALHRELKDAARDGLTGCWSRRVIEPWIETELAQLSPGMAVSVVFVDLNGLKVINDTRGHAAGDAVIAEVARRLQRVVAADDLVARYGGDEFIVAVRGPVGLGDDLAARIQVALDFQLHWIDQLLSVSGSVGVAEGDAGTATELIAAADRAMYVVKRSR